MPNSPRLLAFAGSARRESFNKKLLAVVVEAARAAGAEVDVIDLNAWPMPLYHGDLEDEQGMPENAQKLVAAIVSHHGLLIASPEYNSMITPLLKNTIDWCSRADENPFIGKVVGVASASPGMFGGVRSATLARQLLLHLGCHVVPEQCTLPLADKAFDAQGQLTNPRVQETARKLAAAVADTARKLYQL